MSMTKRHAQDLEAMFARLARLGISRVDAEALRRISMTLRAWHELECNEDIVRGKIGTAGGFVHDDDGQTFVARHGFTPRPGGTGSVRYFRIPDRETGARKRLATVMARYPELVAYVQTDPRGCALHVMRKDALGDSKPDEVYNSRGVAVFQ